MTKADEILGEAFRAAMISAARNEHAAVEAYIDARARFVNALLDARQMGLANDVHRIEALVSSLDVEFRGLFASADEAALYEFRLRGERAYSEMYDAHNFTSAAVCYSDAKDFFASAIGAARKCGRLDEAERLLRRLDHIRKVYRSQFT